jgi:hypothetical protein
MSNQQTYVPGMCNINAAEVAYRRKAMWFGIALSALLLIALIILNAMWWMIALVLFVPVFIGAVGFLQVKNKFCVSYGASGQQNASEGSKAASKVSSKNALIDKKKARTMNLQALAITIAVLIVVSFVSTVT